MKIYLIRHGERKHGKEQDILTDRGIEQSKRVALFLKDKEINKVKCGTTNRARKTAMPFLESFKGDMEYTDSVNEQNLGILQGKTAEEWRKAVVESGLNEKEFRPEGGENRQDAIDRAIQFVKKIKQEPNNKTMAIFSHSGFISDFCCLILNESFENKSLYKTNMGGVIYLKFEEDFNLISKDINILDHLD